ncbi:MAG: hypothetical protein KJ852_09895 [Gammaproteobacteria bacterium]|nr:hypothetical protein [Gammaproteobacteria bacterium]MBU0787791.1 hypothetical protein [Gammaproteobacteria bacterium]MBU0817090.1 hypothetical protein [Gammaproteobacteria bacterium]MBU1787254.1 hypothetical protein [Gammaproteobacteria bacterium]
MDKPQLRFGEDAHPLMKSLQKCIDELPKESLNFVAAVVASKCLITPPLSDLIFGMIYIRNGINIEPVHAALATVMTHRSSQDSRLLDLRDEKLAFIRACGSLKAAETALQFIYDLPKLVNPTT